MSFTPPLGWCPCVPGFDAARFIHVWCIYDSSSFVFTFVMVIISDGHLLAPCPLLPVRLDRDFLNLTTFGFLFSSFQLLLLLILIPWVRSCFSFPSSWCLLPSNSQHLHCHGGQDSLHRYVPSPVAWAQWSLEGGVSIFGSKWSSRSARVHVVMPARSPPQKKKHL